MVIIPLDRFVGGSKRYPHTHKFSTVGHTTVSDSRSHLAQYRWSKMTKKRKDGTVLEYVLRYENRRTIYLHRVIAAELGFPLHLEVDHIDGNGLNNCDDNLRPATNSQNGANKRKQPGTSRFKGVSWNRLRKKWRAQIEVNGKQIHLGLFDTEEAAALAYNAAATEFFGTYAQFNKI